MTFLGAVLYSALAAAPAPPVALLADIKAGQEVYATFDTSLGTFTCKLLSKQAPDLVSAFVGWATGEKTWTDLRQTTTLAGQPLFDGTWIYRAVPGFVIQGGDPFNTGLVPLPYPFQDPVKEGGTFDAAGALATVSAGPDPQGSEFFITVVPTPWLNGRHTVFGRVVAGMAVVDAISRVPVGVFNRPVTPVIVRHVRITPDMPVLDSPTKNAGQQPGSTARH